MNAGKPHTCLYQTSPLLYEPPLSDCFSKLPSQKDDALHRTKRSCVGSCRGAAVTISDTAVAKCGALDLQAKSGKTVTCMSGVTVHAQVRDELNQRCVTRCVNGYSFACCTAKRVLGHVTAPKKLPCHRLQVASTPHGVACSGSGAAIQQPCPFEATSPTAIPCDNVHRQRPPRTSHGLVRSGGPTLPLPLRSLV